MITLSLMVFLFSSLAFPSRHSDMVSAKIKLQHKSLTHHRNLHHLELILILGAPNPLLGNTGMYKTRQWRGLCLSFKSRCSNAGLSKTCLHHAIDFSNSRIFKPEGAKPEYPHIMLFSTQQAADVVLNRLTQEALPVFSQRTESALIQLQLSLNLYCVSCIW